MTKTEIDYVTPQWSAPFHVQALTTLRLGGYSQGDYRGLNLADHVGDDFARVKKNRSLLGSSIGYPADPYWLEQVHGSRVVQLDAAMSLVLLTEASPVFVGLSVPF